MTRSSLERELITALQHVLADDQGQTQAREFGREVLCRVLGPRWEQRFREDLADLRRSSGVTA